jgi:hypothetical protein
MFAMRWQGSADHDARIRLVTELIDAPLEQLEGAGPIFEVLSAALSPTDTVAAISQILAGKVVVNEAVLSDLLRVVDIVPTLITENSAIINSTLQNLTLHNLVQIAGTAPSLSRGMDQSRLFIRVVCDNTIDLILFCISDGGFGRN